MSFNHSHMDINRSNYEEFFLLYVDGELTPQECDAVETFAAAHPDLQEELDILLTTRLNAEPVVFLDKSALMADSMKTTAIDESLLSYIDNELKGEEKAGLEWELEKDKDLQRQHQLLLKTKLDPSEKIVYPNKEELYRHQERAVRPMFWLRAAAVVILVGWGAFWYMDNYNGQEGNTDVAINTTPTAPRPTTTTPANSNTAPVVNAAPEETTPSVTDTPAETSTTAQQSTAVAVRTTPKVTTKAPTPQPVAEPVVIALTEGPETSVATAPSRVETIDRAPQQNINAPAVTLPNAGTYNSIEVPNSDGTRESVAKGDNDKKGSMRGFLRKTTRFIERRTGIDPTNEGDELMIGALTINLK